MNHLLSYRIVRQTVVLVFYSLLTLFCSAQKRGASDAIDVVNHFIRDNFNRRDGFDAKLQQPNSVSETDAPYYIFSVSKDRGFVIVSADQRMPAVLAYSENGLFDSDNIPPNVQYWLDCYEEVYTALKNRPDTDGNETGEADGKNQGEEVLPILGNNHWGQDEPFNWLCPTVRGVRCVTGCVSTAMSQVMYHYKYPAQGLGTVNYRTNTNSINISHDLTNITFRWNDMLDDYNGNYTQSQGSAVAELMYACGTSVKMDYCTGSQGGSGAYQVDLVTSYVNYFGYDKDAAFMTRNTCSIEDWHKLLIGELNSNRPVNYSGHSSRDGGHSFVIDGYRWRSNNTYPDYHVNWGWDGSCDGYYQIAYLHPTEGGQSMTGGAFSESQQMTLNIKPEDGVDENISYLATSNIRMSASSVKPGNTIQVYTASCANLSYQKFQGTVYVVLISESDGSEYLLGSGKSLNLNYAMTYNNLSIDITIPNTVPEGKYIVQYRSKLNKDDKYCQVYSKSYASLAVSNSAKPDNVVPNDALLGCSEIEVTSSIQDPTILKLNVYEVQNLMESPFIGDLRMILADVSGKMIKAFGDSIQPGELGMHEIQEDPLSMSGNPTGTLPDGNYRIYIGARMINTADFVYLCMYDLTRPELNNTPLYLTARIEDGILIINGNSFNLNTTVPDLKNSRTQSIKYDVTGKKQNSIESIRGIYIINGKKYYLNK